MDIHPAQFCVQHSINWQEIMLGEHFGMHFEFWPNDRHYILENLGEMVVLLQQYPSQSMY